MLKIHTETAANNCLARIRTQLTNFVEIDAPVAAQMFAFAIGIRVGLAKYLVSRQSN